MRRWAPLALLVVGLVVLGNCMATSDPSGQSEPTAEAQEPVITPGAVHFVPPSKQRSETSIALSPTTAIPPTKNIVVGFNENNAATISGWAVSTNQGVNWTVCNFGTTTAPCSPNPPNVAVPLAAGQTGFKGDPILVADGTGVVVYVSIGTSNATKDDAKFVLASLSFDSGLHFTATQIVNDDACNNGGQDQPTAAFDMTVTPPRLVVAWRHNGAGTFGGCLRGGGVINKTTHTIDWLGNTSNSVSNMNTQTGWGIGGVIVQAGFGATTLVYSDTGHDFQCPDTSLKGISWYSLNTPDNGLTWGNSTLITHTESFRWCNVNATEKNTFRAFGFIEDTAGTYYAAINAGPNTVTVFQSSNQGASWRLPTTLFVSGAPSLFFPTLASDGPGRLGLTVYASDNTDTKVRPFFFGNVAVRNNQAAFQGPTAFGTGFFAPDVNGSNQLELGDYMGMTAVQTDTCSPAVPTYFSAWTDLSASVFPISDIDEIAVQLTP